jgi:hypothetical protein
LSVNRGYIEGRELWNNKEIDIAQILGRCNFEGIFSKATKRGKTEMRISWIRSRRLLFVESRMKVPITAKQGNNNNTIRREEESTTALGVENLFLLIKYDITIKRIIKTFNAKIIQYSEIGL